MKIDKIIYINLDHRTDRRNWMDGQLASINIPYERFSAISPTIESLTNKDGQYNDFYTRLAVKDKSPRWEMGTIGCYLSHLTIHKLAHERNFGNYIILEDDCVFSQESLDIVKQNLNDEMIGDDWDIIRSTWFSDINEIFKYDYCTPMSKFYTKLSEQNIRSRADFLHSKYAKWINKNKNKLLVASCGGTHFQVIKKSSISKIIKYLNDDHVLPIDMLYTTNVLNVYDSRFGIRADKNFSSDIH